jgi:hypothetical protein
MVSRNLFPTQKTEATIQGNGIAKVYDIVDSLTNAIVNQLTRDRVISK